MTKQNPVFFQFYLADGQEAACRSLLSKGGNPQIKEEFFAFNKLPNVHFARWLVVPATSTIKASVIYSSNIDGDPYQHIQDLVSVFAAELDQILSCCVGYPSTENRNAESRLLYLKKHFKKTPGFYVGAPNRTVQQVHQEAELNAALRQFLQSNKGKWHTPREVYQAIQHFLANDPRWDWARKQYHYPRKQWVKMFFFTLFLLIILPILLVVIVCIHFFYELREVPYGITVNQLPQEHLNALQTQEDKIFQNQLSQIFETKTGLRRIMLHFMLWATTKLAAYWFVDGQLLGTPTIHFARWVLIDGGKRFVFFSNFDGSFDEYLGDFVDNSGWGLNAIYGASVGYPRTFFVFGGGAYKILQFMGWGRKSQVPTQVWYSAYPWYGLEQIASNSLLRQSLFNKETLSDKQVKQMLKRI